MSPSVPFNHHLTAREDELKLLLSFLGTNYLLDVLPRKSNVHIRSKLAYIHLDET